jgi:uncharacterized protein YjbJ (UPF0337 family)
MTNQMDDRTDGMLDQAEGTAKEMGGKLTDNEDLEADGKLDQAAGRVKEGMADVTDAAKDVVKKLTD